MILYLFAGIVKNSQLMQKNGLTFAPESGRLQPSVYLEFRDRLKEDSSNLLEIEKSLRNVGRTYNNLKEFQSFIQNPTNKLFLEDIPDRLSKKIYDLLSPENSTKALFKGDHKSYRTVIQWRGVLLPSGSEVIVQHTHHTHAQYDLDYGSDTEDLFTLVSKEAVDKFLQENSFR